MPPAVKKKQDPTKVRQSMVIKDRFDPNRTSEETIGETTRTLTEPERKGLRGASRGIVTQNVRDLREARQKEQIRAEEAGKLKESAQREKAKQELLLEA